MKSYSVVQYVNAGCSEVGFQSIQAVHMITGGKVCDTGCHAFNGGNCKAYRNLVTGKEAAPIFTETVREEAARRGVSISQVRKERNPA